MRLSWKKVCFMLVPPGLESGTLRLLAVRLYVKSRVVCCSSGLVVGRKGMLLLIDQVGKKGMLHAGSTWA